MAQAPPQAPSSWLESASAAQVRLFVRSYGIGITGSVACGKTTVMQVLQDQGYITLYADDLAYQLTQPHQPGWKALQQHIPGEFFRADLALDRRALAAALPSSPQLKADLEAALHPLIEQEFQRAVEQIMLAGQLEGRLAAWQDGARAQPTPYFFYEAALILETGSAGRFKRVVVVSCDEEDQLQRLMLRQQVTEAQAKAWIGLQLSPADKRAQADYVLDSSCDAFTLRQRVDALVEWLEGLSSDQQR